MNNLYNICLSAEALNTVMEALGELPFKRVYLLIEDINKQATEQSMLEAQQREAAIAAMGDDING